MPITVNGPNGVTVNFPDGTDAGTIHSVMSQAVGGQASPMAAPSPTAGFDPDQMQLYNDRLARLKAGAGTSATSAASDSAMRSGTLGLASVADRLMAAGEAGVRAIGGAPFGKTYDALRAADTSYEGGLSSAHPVASVAGSVAGGAVLNNALTGIPGAADVAAGAAGAPALTGVGAKVAQFMAPAQGGVAAQVGKGAAQGAVLGVTYSTLDQGDPVSGALSGAALGAALPAATGAVRGAYDQLAGRTVVPAEDIARQMGAAFQKDAQTGAKGLVDANTGIPLTRGQATQDFSQIAKEEAMRNDALGKSAGNTMRQFDTGQAQRIGDVASGLVGGDPGRALTDAGVITDRIGQAFQTAKDATGAAYQKAASANAVTDASMFNKIGTVIKGELQSGSDPIILDRRLYPAASQAINHLDNLIPPTTGGDKIIGVTAQKLETTRRVLNSYYKAASTPADQMAVKRIIGRFDDVWDTMAENGLFSGSDEAINALKVARQMRRDQGVKFEPQNNYDTAGKFIQSVINGDRSETEVANYLFGQSKIGQSGASVRAVDRLKTIFGHDSPEIARVQQGAVDRLLYSPDGTLYGPQRMVSRINDYIDGAGRQYASQLHTAEQLKALKDFRDAVAKTVPPKGTTNPSGTAWAMSRIIQGTAEKLMQAIGVTTGGVPGMAVVTLAKKPAELMNAAAARSATRGNFPIPKLHPTPLFAAVQGISGTEGGVSQQSLQK